MGKFLNYMKSRSSENAPNKWEILGAMFKDVGASMAKEEAGALQALNEYYGQKEAQQQEINMQAQKYATEQAYKAQELKIKKAELALKARAYQNGVPVFTIDPASGQIIPSGNVPKGSKVVSSPLQIPTSEAGRYTLSNESIKSIADVKNILFPDGTPKSFRGDVAAKAQLARWGALPKDKEGQNVYRKLSTALSGRQLIQTGVAARPEETNLLYKQFYGNVLSDPDALYEGLTQLEDFYKTYNSTLTGKQPVGEAQGYTKEQQSLIDKYKSKYPKQNESQIINAMKKQGLLK